ncbi:MAG: phosphodiesterase [Bacilli bacterium]|jgi:putative phosphoesterase|nr:phosphodiesterase [Bacilli bacterium]
MKLFIISDIHGSLLYASKAVESFKQSQADYLVCLGDFYYHGPRNNLPEGYNPMEVSKLLNPLKDSIIAIKGNCDAEVDQFISTFHLSKRVSLKVGKKKILLIHGHKEVDVSAYDIIISGHTHIALLEERNGKIYANPGSISLPKADNSRDYILLDEKSISLHDMISGNLLKTIAY